MKELSSFLDLVINERVIEPQGDFCYTWKLWEYVDAIETCDRKVTECGWRKDTYFDAGRRCGEEAGRTITIGSVAKLDGLDDVLNWSRQLQKTS